MAFQPTKVDPELGKNIHKHLKSVGVETPTVETSLSEQDKIKEIEKSIRYCLQVLGLDLEDDSLVETPRRVAKMWVNEVMWGLDPAKFPKATAVENKMGYDEMVIEKDIKVSSLCEHHLVQIDGFAHVAYIPKKKVLGLSKMNRIVDYFARRPQIQERLTMQVAEALKFILETDDVAVCLSAQHFCVKARGIEDQTSYTVTTHLSGVFKDRADVRAEFMTTVNSKK